jgi:hypothetical protein
LDNEFGNLLSSAPSFLKPKLNLFLSVDIVGSTAYKQTSRAHKPADDPVGQWVQMVTHFYRDFSITFLTECQKFDVLYKEGWDGEWHPPEEPTLWKVAGDELIYCVTLTDHRFSALFVSAWVSAIKAVRPMLQSYSPKLNLKASAWVAGFPVNNTEVVLGLGKHMAFPWREATARRLTKTCLRSISIIQPRVTLQLLERSWILLGHRWILDSDLAASLPQGD